MEPQYMILGHAAGVAASLSLKSKIPVQDVPVKALQDKLLSQGAVFDWIPPLAGPAFFEKLFQLYEPDAGKRALLPGQ
jgi:hypothetical protein